MTSDVSIEIEGLEELRKQLDPRRMDKFARIALEGGAGIIHAEAQRYPPKSSANRPNAAGRWYERGYGPKWQRQDGTVGGIHSSEQLGKQWTQKIKRLRDGWEAIISNKVGQTYGRYVQDEEKQAHFHKARGWQTVQSIATKKANEVQKLFDQMVQRWMRK